MVRCVLAAGMVAVMDGPSTGPFNIGNPTEFTMLELAQVSTPSPAAGSGGPLCTRASCSI
jgi:hypothetical protein